MVLLVLVQLLNPLLAFAGLVDPENVRETTYTH